MAIIDITVREKLIWYLSEVAVWSVEAQHLARREVLLKAFAQHICRRVGGSAQEDVVQNWRMLKELQCHFNQHLCLASAGLKIRNGSVPWLRDKMLSTAFFYSQFKLTSIKDNLK